MTQHEQEILVAAAVILTTGLAASWMFRKLQDRYTRREAKAVTIAFALCAPISLSAAILLAELSGGYADVLLGPPFGAVGAFVGILVITPIVSFVASVLTLWMTRRIVKLEATH